MKSAHLATTTKWKGTEQRDMPERPVFSGASKIHCVQFSQVVYVLQTFFFRVPRYTEY